MRKFRKKPVVIRAEQYVPGVHVPDCLQPLPDHIQNQSGQEHNLWCPTLEGGLVASPGDWIIQGVKGERYPCKPDIFEATYEEATA